MNYFEKHYDSVRYPIALNGREGLRLAQRGAIHAVATHFSLRTEPAIVVLPTGSGKTAVSMLTAFIERAKRVLVVTPSRLVRNQIAEEYKTLKVLKLNKALDINVPAPRVKEVESRIATEGMWRELESFDVVVGTPDSISPAFEGISQPPEDLFDLLLVDEAHHSTAATWNALLLSFPKAKRVLFTATPFRHDRGEIVGKVVYDYPINKAYEDKIFGKVEYIAVDAKGGNSDVAIAQRAEQIFKEDRAAGRDHFLMVRTGTKTRANELKKLYEQHTKLNLQLIHSGLSYGTVKAAIRKLQNKELDGVICVNMLGEGFDFPQLKIAAVHTPHKSLAVTLQFIGRFARTNADNIGSAKFIAVESEVRGELEKLYQEGAVWQEIITSLARGRIEEEIKTRESIESFAPATDVKLETADVSLHALRPYNHVRVYEVDPETDTQRPIELSGSYSLVYRRPSPGQAFVTFITQEKTSPRWTHLDIFARTDYHLFNVYFDRETNLLFINSSCKNTAIYEQLAQQFSNAKPQCLPLNKINKVLLELKDFEFFSIGMRSRVSKNNVESYRIISGSSAHKAVSPTDGRNYHQGHTFGRAKQGEQDVTIGYSSLSKVWSNTHSSIPAFIEWCRELARRITSDKLVETHCGLDILSVGETVTVIPEGVITAEWDRDAFDHPRMVYYKRTDGSRGEGQLLDFDLNIDRENSDRNRIRFCISNDDVEWAIDFSLTSGYSFMPVDEEEAEDIAIQRGRYPENLVDFLHGYPPSFYFADLSKLHGSELFKPRSDDDLAPFGADRIEVIDWDTAGVDITKEYGPAPGGKVSVHDYLKRELPKTNAQIVFYDHGSGEIADFIAFEQSARETFVRLYHCKRSGGRKAGERVDDVYEVCGQTVKSLIWVSVDKLVARIADRNYRRIDSTFLKGSKSELKMLIAKSKSMPVKFEIIVVQPGISQRKLPPRIAYVLAAADDYIKPQCEGLRVLASA
jgi:superfamily II DNA or RNA helicase